jgi:hypothetical protein
VKNDVWKVSLPNSFFGNYNPYKDLIFGDWFHNWGRIHHTGEVFLNEKSMYEKETEVDYLEQGRNIIHPTAGPFENISEGESKIKVW